MHKVAKLTTAAMFGALVMGAASGCGAKYDLLLWTGLVPLIHPLSNH